MNSLTQEVVDKYSKLVPEQYLTEVDFDPVLEGFQRVCKDAVGALANVVFNDLEEVFVKLFNKEWYEGGRGEEKRKRRKKKKEKGKEIQRGQRRTKKDKKTQKNKRRNV